MMYTNSSYFLNLSQGSNFCLPTSPGTFTSEVGSVFPLRCSRNTYADTYGASICTDCPDGKITLNEGSNACVEPSDQVCSAGQYSKDGKFPCSSCPAGSYNSGAGATACLLCEPGTIADSAGRGICTPCPSNAVSIAGAFVCSVCADDRNLVPNQARDKCVSCNDGEKANQGICIADVTSGSAINGVLSNNGTPLYVMAIMTVVLASLGLLIHNSKEKVQHLLHQPLAKHMLQFALPSASIMSELILAGSILVSGITQLIVPGVLIMSSRLILGVFPGLYVGYVILFSSLPSVDSETQTKTFRYFLDIKVTFEYSKPYAVLLLLACLEPPLLSFLPWFQSEFSNVALFPTMGLLRACYTFKFLQLIVTFTGQLMILSYQFTQGTR